MPGGTFAFDYMVRWNDPPAWLSRLPEGRRALPQEWLKTGDRKLLSDGTELELVAKTVAMDPLEDVATREIRARLWRDGELLKEEIHTQNLEDYSKNKLELMLERYGFGDIQITGDHSDEPARADHKNLVFVARIYLIPFSKPQKNTAPGSKRSKPRKHEYKDSNKFNRTSEVCKIVKGLIRTTKW